LGQQHLLGSTRKTARVSDCHKYFETVEIHSFIDRFF